MIDQLNCLYLWTFVDNYGSKCGKLSDEAYLAAWHFIFNGDVH